MTKMNSCAQHAYTLIRKKTQGKKWRERERKRIQNNFIERRNFCIIFQSAYTIRVIYEYYSTLYYKYMKREKKNHLQKINSKIKTQKICWKTIARLHIFERAHMQKNASTTTITVKWDRERKNALSNLHNKWVRVLSAHFHQIHFNFWYVNRVRYIYIYSFFCICYNIIFIVGYA